jgi:branched-chain amino acid transport system substrate-binding protein
VKVQQWDGVKWQAVTPNWVIGDQALVGGLVAESSQAYAAEKHIVPACAR